MAMKRSRKIALFVVALLVVLVAASVWYQRRQTGVVAVQAGAVKRRDLKAIVTASGEIRPLHYVNINSQSFGKITAILVEEGARVKQGQVLLRMEAVQPAADVKAQRANVASAQAAVESAQASLKTAQAELERARADFQRAMLDWERAQGLYSEQLISQQEYDARKAEFESARASVELSESRLRQARAELERARSNLQQTRAQLTRVSDVLEKTVYTSPIDGVVTNLPVHVGENMVPGIQNSTGSFLMTVADMSEVTAEVMVDETDIVNVELGQPAEVSIDAFPDRTFPGRITEIGTTALVRSTGRSTAELETGTQEAKDFKVVATLDNPPATIRPGLSTTARITTATREDALAVPIQALTIRQKSDIEAAERESGDGESARAATVAANPEAEEEDQELQGVFVIQDGQARFQPVETGITGVTDVEVTRGLEEGQKIITGSYRVLRELRHLARVRVEEPGERRGRERED